MGSTLSSSNQSRQPFSCSRSIVMTWAMAPAWYSARASRRRIGSAAPDLGLNRPPERHCLRDNVRAVDVDQVPGRCR